MQAREDYHLEYKKEVSKTFLKTVSAYANYNDGIIIFGVDDFGEVIGMKENIKEESLRIENMINDSITPTPKYEIRIEQMKGKTIIVLEVKKGSDTPYYCNGKVYRRSDSATVEVDRFELRRLAVEGLNMNEEDKKATSQQLTFIVLEEQLKKEAGIETINLDILKTLNLYDKAGYYNMAGELLADKNDIVFSGIDIVKFGKDINTILYRKTIDQVSLLTQLNQAIEIFEQYYIFEEIEGFNRVERERIPKEAFREALANAIVHRVWDVNSYIQVAMYRDSIRISSPGGLPERLTKEEYLYGNISVLRNPVIAGVFARLHIIEKFGTGIARINKEYTNNLAKPQFDVSENRIQIVLPTIDVKGHNLSSDEKLVVELLRDGTEFSRKEVDRQIGFEKSKSLRILNRLVDKNIIAKSGGGASVTYHLKN